jgi:hypothetical protein
MVPYEELTSSPSVTSLPKPVNVSRTGVTPRSVQVIATGFTLTLSAGALALLVAAVVRLWQWAI